MNNEPCKTPWEDLKQKALEHYEEASSAISHWSSFVVAAIKAYQEPKIENNDTAGKSNEGSI